MKIGRLEFVQPIVLAPMENVTDLPFRTMARRLGADWVYTEFSSSEALVRGQEKVIRKIRISPEERPVGIQIFGNDPDRMAFAAQISQELQPDFIDINCGCWSRHHAMRGECAGLLRDLPLLEKILKSVVKATPIPITVKTRLGWDEKSIVIPDVARIAEHCGVQALTVHCRTRDQAYKGRADWGWLEKIRPLIKIPLIGNGDAVTPQDVKTLFDLGCDGVMIGRGALHNPWIFKQAKEFLKTGIVPAFPSLAERVSECLEHLRHSVAFRGEKFGVLHFRKYFSGYLRDIPHVAHLRAELMQLTTEEQVRERLHRFLAPLPLDSSEIGF